MEILTIIYTRKKSLIWTQDTAIRRLKHIQDTNILIFSDSILKKSYDQQHSRCKILSIQKNTIYCLGIYSTDIFASWCSGRSIFENSGYLILQYMITILKKLRIRFWRWFMWMIVFLLLYKFGEYLIIFVIVFIILLSQQLLHFRIPENAPSCIWWYPEQYSIVTL